jgi:hypothetical protein
MNRLPADGACHGTGTVASRNTPAPKRRSCTGLPPLRPLAQIVLAFTENYRPD